MTTLAAGRIRTKAGQLNGSTPTVPWIPLAFYSFGQEHKYDSVTVLRRDTKSTATAWRLLSYWLVDHAAKSLSGWPSAPGKDVGRFKLKRTTSASPSGPAPSRVTGAPAQPAPQGVHAFNLDDEPQSQSGCALFDAGG